MLRKGSTIIAGVATNTINNAHSLFDFIWSDHIKNEMSWLRSDTFSWQSGSVYTFAYQHLTADLSTATQSTETIAGTTITVYTATDGHKIVLADQEANVSAIYSATGVAWYYIVDTANTQFKLPRTQYGFNGIRDTVGEYINPGVPNIVGTWDYPYSTYSASGTVTGAFEAKRSIYGEGATGGYYQGWAIDFSASRSNPIYGSSNTVQPSATQMYLYFYVGEFSQSATEQTAGITTEQLNAKMETDASNATATGKSTIVGWGMPDYSSAVSVSNNFTAPSYGFVSIFSYTNSASDQYCYVDGIQIIKWKNAAAYSDTTMGTMFPISPNQVVTFSNTSNLWAKFFPLKGV